MKKLKSSLTNMVLVLTMISFVAGGALAFVNQITQGPIEEINNDNLQEGIKQVILGQTSGTLHVEAPDTAENGFVIYRTDKGTAVKSTASGFGGLIEVLVGFNKTGDILGYTILNTSETPGLGAKADTWFQKDGKGNIIGLNPGENNLTVSKDGGEVDAITASTITSRAFLNAVNAAYQTLKGEPSDAWTGASPQANNNNN